MSFRFGMGLVSCVIKLLVTQDTREPLLNLTA